MGRLPSRRPPEHDPLLQVHRKRDVQRRLLSLCRLKGDQRCDQPYSLLPEDRGLQGSML